MEIFSEANKIEMKVYDLLKGVIDPEVEISIIEMGLVYKILLEPDNCINIEMTLSSRSCPMGEMITEDVKKTITEAFPDYLLNLKLVWDPEWTPEFLTNEGRKKLGYSF